MHQLILLALLGPFALPPEASGVPATRPSPESTTQSSLKAVELRFGDYLGRIEVRIAITSGGLLSSVRTDGKSWGKGDIDPKHERKVNRQGQLTAEQMGELARLFEGWDSLESDYPAVPDDGDISIRYGDEVVRAGQSLAPPQVSKVYAKISELAEKLPVVER